MPTYCPETRVRLRHHGAILARFSGPKAIGQARAAIRRWPQAIIELLWAGTWHPIDDA